MRHYDIRPIWMAGFISVCLSLLLSAGTIINSDGILYLTAAKAFQESDFNTGLQLFNWPFYSLFVAYLSKWTSLSLETAAHLIDAILMGLLVSGFVALVKELRGNRTIQWLGALIILIHPGINGYREYVIRDFGGWAGMMWSVVFLCRRQSIGWTLSTLLAVLFRPEMIIWTALGPFVYVRQFKSVLKLQQFYIIGAVLGLIALLVMDISLPHNKLLAQFGNGPMMLKTMGEAYSEKAGQIADIMSIFFKKDHAMVMLAPAMIFYWLYLTLKLLSPMYVLLVGYGLYHRDTLCSEQLKVIYWALAVFMALYVAYLFRAFFISSRYLVPWVTLMMVWVPFALHRFWTHHQIVLKIFVAMILLLMAIDGVVSFGYSKDYLRDAGHWIRDNTPAGARCAIEENHVRYYAHCTPVAIDDNPDVIAIKYSRKDKDAHALIDQYADYPQQDFHNKRMDGVRVIVMGEG